MICVYYKQIQAVMDRAPNTDYLPYKEDARPLNVLLGNRLPTI